MSLLTTQDPEAIERRERFCWVEAGVWTDRMLAALGNGVKGGKWTSTVAEFLLRRAWPVHLYADVHCSEPIPMRKHLTGEPYAAEPHVRFGGRGGLSPSPPLSCAIRKIVRAASAANRASSGRHCRPRNSSVILAAHLRPVCSYRDLHMPRS